MNLKHTVLLVSFIIITLSSHLTAASNSHSKHVVGAKNKKTICSLEKDPHTGLPDNLEHTLMKAILKNDCATVKRLIQAGVNVNYVYSSGTTPLVEASLFACEEICVLIKQVANPLTDSEQNYLVQMSKALNLPLQDKKRKQFIKRLLTPRPSQRQKKLEQCPGNKRCFKLNTSVQLGRFVHATQGLLITALLCHDYGQVRETLSRLHDYHNKKNELYYIFTTPRSFLHKNKIVKFTPLQLAAELKDEKMLRVLLDAGPPESLLQNLPPSCHAFIEQNKHRATEARQRLHLMSHKKKQRAQQLTEEGAAKIIQKAGKIIHAYIEYRNAGSKGTIPYCKERIALALHNFKVYTQCNFSDQFPEIPLLQ